MVGNRIPSEIRRRYGLVADRDVGAVLDASGFAYSDSFGSWRAQREAIHGRRWARARVPRILLPQAFGPYNDRDVRRWSTEVLRSSELVFARDSRSFEYAASLLGADSRLKISPDFTIGLKPDAILPRNPELAYIVPNAKIYETGQMSERDYATTLIEWIGSLKSIGMEPRILVHEKHDEDFAESLGSATGSSTESVDDPLMLKAVIASSALLVAGRYHAIVSALSQGVPAISFGWSHKYEYLLRDFDAPELQWGVGMAPHKDLLAAALSVDLSGRLAVAGKQLVERNEEMWCAVEDVLNESRIREK